jgi:acyl transferase domain-containing protein
LVVDDSNRNIENIKTVKSKTVRIVPGQIGFMFPGQGSQYLQMGKDLYEREYAFKEAIDHCAEILKGHLKPDIREIIFPSVNNQETEDRLKDTKFTQPAIFVIEYALAKLWMSWSIEPSFVCGHSIGEFVAAHIAGIFTLEDALDLITARGKLVSELPGGSMLSVRSAAEIIEKELPETLSMAAINSDNLCVVSGTDEEIQKFSDKLKSEGVASMVLATSHAFHSTMMDPALPVFEEKIKKITLSSPKIPLVSTVTGNWMSDEQATDPKYWTDHLRDAVRFSHAMDTVFEMEDKPLLLEVGPGRALTTLIRQKKDGKKQAVVSTMPKPKNEQTDHHSLLNAIGELWLNGIEIDWQKFYEGQSRQKVLLPSYVYDRKPCWVEPPLEAPTSQSVSGLPNTVVQITAPVAELKEDQTRIENIPNANFDINSTFMRRDKILQKVSEIISKTSGIELEDEDTSYSFLELGLDSLILTQLASTCKNEFNAAITFRQLSDELNSPALLADYLDQNLPEEAFADRQLAQPAQAQIQQQPAQPITPVNIQPATTFSTQQAMTNTTSNSALSLISQQLQLLGKQIELIQNNGMGQVPAGNVSNNPAPTAPAVGMPGSNKDARATEPTTSTEDILTKEEKEAFKKPFGASPRIEKSAIKVDSRKEVFLNTLIERYNKKTAGSKAYSQRHRSYMADPRVVSGFKPLTKELVYPIVAKRSSGNRLWDLDDNEYIDVLNGFGACLFGHQPDFIKEALHKQVDLGFEVGPQHPLAGEVCKLLCEFTNHDRAALCNTGSEAVLGAMRIARTVTGRSLIVSFSGSYHGINDEALIRGSKKLKTFPAAAGILADNVQNILVLDYGTEESLRIIKERAHELAAVLVEPVQSRRPEFQPIEFLKEVRKITEASQTALIFDEIITGFRFHPGGTQALFDVKADIATYGKVIGGGISIGAITGSKMFMDALDGGFWQYGDESFPEAGVTYFAGTFVRHPLALASCKASLLFFKEQGPELQLGLNRLTDDLANELNTAFEQRNLPLVVNHYGSLWRLKVTKDIPYSELLFVLLREKGIHIMDGFPCYMTISFTKDDINQVIRAIFDSVDELIEAGIFNENDTGSVLEKPEVTEEKSFVGILNTPPVAGAKLGKDASGNPAWFVADKNGSGNYVKIDL